MLVRIVSDNISFGCMKGQMYHDNTRQVCIILYESINRAHVRFVPAKNDIVWCKYYHSSVLMPIALVNEAHLCLRSLVNMPCDVLCHYFPLVEYR